MQMACVQNPHDMRTLPPECQSPPPNDRHESMFIHKKTYDDACIYALPVIYALLSLKFLTTNLLPLDSPLLNRSNASLQIVHVSDGSEK